MPENFKQLEIGDFVIVVLCKIKTKGRHPFGDVVAECLCDYPISPADACLQCEVYRAKKRAAEVRVNVIGFRDRQLMLSLVPVAQEKFGIENVDYAYADQINNLKITCSNKKAWNRSRKWEAQLRKQYSADMYG